MRPQAISQQAQLRLGIERFAGNKQLAQRIFAGSQRSCGAQLGFLIVDLARCSQCLTEQGRLIFDR
jgi:hypothetical protein